MLLLVRQAHTYTYAHTREQRLTSVTLGELGAVKGTLPTFTSPLTSWVKSSDTGATLLACVVSLSLSGSPSL